MAASLLAALLTAGCGSAPTPTLRSGFPKEPARVLVFVPGILGSKLVAADGRSVWGSGMDVLLPRDGGYEMAHPLLDQERDTIRPAGIVDKVPLGPLYQRDVYRRVLDWLVLRGYRVGDLERPAHDSQASLFGFAYDFRRTNEEAVERLRRQLVALAAARGQEQLDFDLLCQSNGAYICRLLVIRESFREPSERLIPTRMTLIGTANGGGLRTLRELRDGRVYVPTLGLGRQFQPEVIFSFRSVFLDLPHADSIRPRGSHPVFFDPSGAPLEIDLYDAETWQRRGWSVFSDEAARRLARPRAQGIFGDEASRLAYLQERLASAVQLQRELRQGPRTLGHPPALLSIQARHLPTIDGAVLTTMDDRERAWFFGDPEISELSEATRARLASPGDQHATIRSQEWLSTEEASWLVDEPMIVEAQHADLVMLPDVLDRLATFFLESAPTTARESTVSGPGGP